MVMVVAVAIVAIKNNNICSYANSIGNDDSNIGSNGNGTINNNGLLLILLPSLAYDNALNTIS